MEIFEFKDKTLHMEQVSLLDVANTYQTPCYVYSANFIKDKISAYQSGFGDHAHLICYSVKANSNLSILKLIKDTGAGFDIVSGGELQRLLAIGVDPALIIFSGVGKTVSEINDALDAGVLCFNVESEQELERIESIARDKNMQAPISLRINPDVDAKTHPYISTGLKDNKFGIDINLAHDIYLKAHNSGHLKIVGVDCHIGSQLTDMEPYADAIKRISKLIDKLNSSGIEIEHFDIGGGLGVTYKDENPPHPLEFAAKLVELIGDKVARIIIEPGRSIIANAGVFLTKVEYLKHHEHKNFCIVDGAMNDLLRPALYSGWHNILSLRQSSSAGKVYDVVGPVCESTDFLGKERELNIKQEDILAIMGCGAYAFTMASNYNSRPKAAEVLVDGAKHRAIRPRETIVDLFVTELKSL